MPERPSPLRSPQVWTFVAGDTLAFLLFAALGRNSHHEASSALQTVGTALPFIAGWFAVSPWTGIFPARRPAPRTLLQRTGVAWLCAWPIALLVRLIVLHGGVTVSFAIVALLFNALFLLGWRGTFAWLLARR